MIHKSGYLYVKNLYMQMYDFTKNNKNGSSDERKNEMTAQKKNKKKKTNYLE